MSGRTGLAAAGGRRSVWAAVPRADLRAVAADWTRIGGYFGITPATSPVDLERLLVTTARVAPDDERLFVVAASWLAAHHAFVNGRRLAGLASAVAPRAPEADTEVSAVLGALLSWASELAGGAEALDVAAARCQPLREARPLFRVVALLPSLAAAAEREACPAFARWGLWHNDQTPKPEAVRPVAWLLAHAPELRIRALAGPSVEADIVAAVLVGLPAAATSAPAVAAAANDITVRDISRALGVSYAATHEAAEKLVRRGVLRRERRGARQLLRATATAAQILAGSTQRSVRG